ncbi:interleukin-15 receptor subunit alpha isoform X16 [Colossoma macropomum]|uniref:interleukin-15 receptor subunit alpha isoform X16 n=1 Tax=Colossoma macropomum TaxID=42526 RepID=UPI001863A7C7|nr:interleukin-15 receptor subunit alpha isoform X16 [Colossoma macropomum]
MRASLLLFILTAAKYTFTGVYAGPSKPMSSTVMCEAPEPKNNAKTPDKLEPRFRMQCIDGYVRQAGTSNLYRCEKKDNLYLWVNEPSLNCIPDPSKPGSTAVMCEAPEPKNNTKTPGKLESQFRMQCIDGYVRQAGTSNLYRCEKKDNLYLWVNEPSLNCIPDPSKPGSTAVMCEAPEPKNNTKTPGKLESQFRMQCIDGYVRQAGTSNLYRCEKKDNLYLWVNEPSLNCIPDPSKPGSTAVMCEAPEPKNNTKTPGKLESQFRMQCIDGYVRQAGTSNLYRCEKKDNLYLWVNEPSLNCIPDPSKPGSTAADPSKPGSTAADPSTLVSSAEANERNKAEFSVLTKNGIAAGTVLTLTVIAASAVGVFLWCRRSRQGAVSIPPEEMILQAPGSDKPLLDTPTTTSSCLSDSVQNPDSPPPLTV